MITRFSSRKHRLDATFLNARLAGGTSYDRIAGYFSSSLMEVAGEALENLAGPIRIVCNSDLLEADVATARAATNAVRQEWCAAEPEKYGDTAQPRFAKLYALLKSGKMQVRVLPKDKFGLAHGKAGVITLPDGTQTCFMGSANETKSAWKLNYELVWEDDSREGIDWVQEEFDALWSHPCAVPLGEFVIEDIGRLVKREVIRSVEVWRQDPNEASPVIETPVYRREYGLWEHQKYFVKLAFDAHRGPHGARFVLGDMVGLGKTVQLGLAAMLMALYGTRPVLILCPKTLVLQWQDELRNLLDLPSAIWTGKAWLDENGIEHPATGPEGIKKCPRRFGIVSYGLVKSKSEAVEYLKEMRFECIIVDEVHNARRTKLSPGSDEVRPNNLLAFLQEIAPRTKSFLMGTATPVQINPIEAWDFLDVLARDNDSVLGNTWSNWRGDVDETLNLVMGRTQLPMEERARWHWIRNPLPPTGESKDFDLLRRSLKLKDEDAVATGDSWMKLSAPDQARVARLAKDFALHHNPFIRHIVRRTRDYLETTKDPETGEPYLQPVKVILHGEDDIGAIPLTPYLKEAYEHAEEFCRLLSARVKGAGFLKTMLLRRVGSTIEAGKNTVEKMLSTWRAAMNPLDTAPPLFDAGEDAEEDDAPDDAPVSEMRSLTEEERQKLTAFLNAMKANQERDPKYAVVQKLLINDHWLELGCIIFSQYFASIWWLAEQLTRDLPGEKIGIYAGSGKSGIMLNGEFTPKQRDVLKAMVKKAEIRLLLGTDAASEGLNLQRLGTLINLDLPWNPTRLEQRKGRIQRIGQTRDTVDVYNMRYKDSVEDRVHALLSTRLQNIHQIFGQLPDVLQDVWVEVALGQIDKARKTIDAVPDKHPFDLRYHRIAKVPWETCSKVLDAGEKRKTLLEGW